MYHRALKPLRIIIDPRGSESIQMLHVTDALQYEDANKKIE